MAAVEGEATDFHEHTAVVADNVEAKSEQGSPVPKPARRPKKWPTVRVINCSSPTLFVRPNRPDSFDNPNGAAVAAVEGEATDFHEPTAVVADKVVGPSAAPDALLEAALRIQCWRRRGNATRRVARRRAAAGPKRRNVWLQQVLVFSRMPLGCDPWAHVYDVTP